MKAARCRSGWRAAPRVGGDAHREAAERRAGARAIEGRAESRRRAMRAKTLPSERGTASLQRARLAGAAAPPPSPPSSPSGSFFARFSSAVRRRTGRLARRRGAAAVSPPPAAATFPRGARGVRLGGLLGGLRHAFCRLRRRLRLAPSPLRAAILALAAVGAPTWRRAAARTCADASGVAGGRRPRAVAAPAARSPLPSPARAAVRERHRCSAAVGLVLQRPPLRARLPPPPPPPPTRRRR